MNQARPASVSEQEVVELLLLGGRSGVGKTSVAHEVSEQLQTAEMAHCLVDGDNLDAIYPKPSQDPEGRALTEANLSAIWANYAAVGQRRLIYVNSVSVLEKEMIVRAVGGTARVHSVLLTASDETVRVRLGGREFGYALELHMNRSATIAVLLEKQAGADVVRIETDGRSVHDVARAVLAACRWRS